MIISLSQNYTTNLNKATIYPPIISVLQGRQFLAAFVFEWFIGLQYDQF